MPTVVESEPEIGLSTRTPFELTPVIVINEPANKFPFSGALIATPAALAPSANRYEPDPSVMSPVNAEAPSSSTPIFPAPPPLTEIVAAAGPSLIKEPVKPPTTCTAMAPPPAKLFVIEPWLSTLLLESKVTAAPAALMVTPAPVLIVMLPGLLLFAWEVPTGVLITLVIVKSSASAGV